MKFNLQIETDDAQELTNILELINGNKNTPEATPAPTPAPAAATSAMPIQQMQTAAEATAAPTPAPTSAPAAAPSGEVDASGMVWDERIHAKTKAKTADGNWRKRRGVDAATVTAVEAELRAGTAPVPQTQSPEEVFGNQQPAPAPVQAPPATPAPQPTPAPTPAPAPQPAPVQAPPAATADHEQIPAFLQRTPEQAAAPQPAQQPAPAPTPAPAATPAPQFTFQQLMAAISQGLREQKIDNAWLGEIVTKYQLPSIPALASTHAESMPQIVAELQQKGVI